MWLVWREYNSHTLEDRALKSLLIHTLFKLASRKAFYTFFFLVYMIEFQLTASAP